MNKPFLDAIFQLLTENKKFPKYQAERRIDLFINIFLEQILSDFYNDGSIIKFICPEFPIKNENSNACTNIDYLCTRTINGNVELIFVELKTDKSSFSDKQLARYFSNRLWSKLKSDVVKIKDSTEKKYRGKYETLSIKIDEEQITENTEVNIIYISPVISSKNLKGYQIEKQESLVELLKKNKAYPIESKTLAKYLDSNDEEEKWDMWVFEIKSLI